MGLVKHTREGRAKVYELQPQRVTDAQRLLDMISTEWDGTLERLRAFVEDDRE